MQAVSMFGSSQFAMLLFFFGGAGALPLGVPPEKENPVMAYVAPDECVLYATWAGMATPNPASPNHTEQLLAEAEVQQFAAALENSLAMIVKSSVGGEGPRAETLSKAGPIWIRSLITRPAALYLTRLAPKAPGPGGPGRGDLSITAEGGLIVQAGDSAALLDAALTEILATEEQKPVEFTIGTRKFHKLAASEDFPIELSWGSGNGYLMVGLGEGALAAMSERIRARQQPAWLTELQADAGVERRSTLSYVNVKKTLESFAPLAGREGAVLLAASGLRQVTMLGSVTGMDETGVVSRTLVSIDGPSKGLLTLLDGEGVAASDLAHIPNDALAAGATSFDAGKAFDVFVASMAEVEPRAATEIKRELEEFEQRTGVDLREAIGGLGDNWSIHAAAADGGLMAAAVTVEVKDQAKLAAAQTALMAIASGEGRGEFSFTKTPFAGQTIFHATAKRGYMPFSPAWCLTDKRLILGLYPQAVKAVLARERDGQAAGKSLADVPQVAAALAGPAGNKPLAITWLDSKALFEATYPTIQVMAPMLLREYGRVPYNRSGDLAGQPPPLFDSAMLPTARSISRHLQPSVTVVRRTADGLDVETRQTLPATNLGTAAPVAVAILLPAVQSARVAAAQMQSSNNLKQQLLALHNFHDVYNRFPAAYSADDSGKPLLSWRVHILPFVEAKPLYDEFKLDEPWDSEHNKKLIAKMPKIYQVPGSKAGPGMTTYLGVGGKDGVLIKPTGRGETSHADGTSIAAILDGTSNTIAIVEGADEAAVIWTKPEEWVPDAKDPRKGLSTRRPTGFLAGLCDGSVTTISPKVEAQTLRLLFSRADGMPIPDFRAPR
jgi:hypothetical protein